jgi:anaerobic ribonucleoside-triphosphate reductase
MAASTITTTKLAGNSIPTRISGNVRFILCGDCYWCASFLDTREVKKCPLCGNENVELSSSEK